MLVVGLWIKEQYNKRCFDCGCELDVEDYFLNNICECCGSSQGYDKDCFKDYNYCKGVLIK